MSSCALAGTAESPQPPEMQLARAVEEGWMLQKDAEGMLRGLRTKVASGKATDADLVEIKLGES